MNVAYNMDCMEYMKTLPDNAFDLAVVDCKRKRYFVMCADCGYVLYDPKDEENDYVKVYDTVSDAVNAWNADTQ